MTSTVIKDELEEYYHILGGKTGTLSGPGAYNLAVILEIPDSDDRLAVVVMYADEPNTGANNRFLAARQVADAALRVYKDPQEDLSGVEVCCRSAIACLLPSEGVDRHDLQILYAKEPDLQLQPASTTKMLTAVCMLDYVEDLNTELTYKEFDTDIGTLYKKDFAPGDTLSLGDALYAMFLPSSNVTARAVGRSVGGMILEKEA